MLPEPEARAEAQETVIGETRTTPRGYAVVVSRVHFPGNGMRIRLTLLKEGARVRHLDVTAELARQLGPLLEEALGL